MDLCYEVLRLLVSREIAQEPDLVEATFDELNELVRLLRPRLGADANLDHVADVLQDNPGGDYLVDRNVLQALLDAADT